MNRAVVFGVVLAHMATACLLATSLDGLAGGGAPDGGALEAGATDGPPDGIPAGDAGDAGDAFPPSNDARAEGDGGPITFLQSNAGNAVDLTLNTVVNQHSAIVVGITLKTTTTHVTQITDSLGATFGTVFGPWDSPPAYPLRFYMAAAFDVRGGSETLSVSLDGPISAIEVYAHEYANVVAFDVAAAANGTTTAIDGMRSGTVATTAPNELIFGFGVSGVVSPGSGFIPRNSFHNNITEDRVVSALGSYEATGTMTGGAEWTMMVATFKGR
jgi:hypothetical protein